MSNHTKRSKKRGEGVENMYTIYWLKDKEKDGERFTNSICFTYCLKCFIEEKRVELWGKEISYAKTYNTKAGALFDYDLIKTIGYNEILRYMDEHFEKK